MFRPAESSTTKRIRLTRDILLGGRHAEKGSICELERGLADDLIGRDCAVHLNLFSRCLLAFRFFLRMSRRTESSQISRGPQR